MFSRPGTNSRIRSKGLTNSIPKSQFWKAMCKRISLYPAFTSLLWIDHVSSYFIFLWPFDYTIMLRISSAHVWRFRSGSIRCSRSAVGSSRLVLRLCPSALCSLERHSPPHWFRLLASPISKTAFQNSFPAVRKSMSAFSSKATIDPLSSLAQVALSFPNMFLVLHCFFKTLLF